MKKIITVSKYTFIEIYKSKIMMNILLLGVAQLIICFIASEFTYGVRERVTLDFGMGVLSLATCGIAIFMGASLVSKEIDSRTIHMILARPIKRYQFLLGRSLGMGGILFVNVLLLGVLSIAFYLFLGGEFNNLLIWVILYAFLEAFIVLNVVLLLSLITNVTMSVIYTIAIYIVGHSLSDTILLSIMKFNPIIEKVLRVYSTIFPNFSKLNIKDQLIYKSSLDLEFLTGALAYGLFYSITLLVIGAAIFRNKSLD